MKNTPALTIVGLGPGPARLLTTEARDALAAADEVWLRTARHPAVAELPAGPVYRSFDELYEGSDSFEAVYDAIVLRVLELARRPQGAVYAVPGHPSYGEATVQALRLRAGAEGIAVRIVQGVSFADAAAAALGIDPVEEGLLLLDGLALGAEGRGLVPQRPTLIGQVYDRRAASQVKLALLEAYPPDHPVSLLGAAGTDEAWVAERPLAELDRDDAFHHLTSIYLTPVAVPEDTRSFEGLRRIVERLRTPETGCPWDLEQTHETLKRFLLEEAYEALDALDEGNASRLAEELGDLLMQVLLQAQVAEDGGEFRIEDVIRSIATKLVRRHPHVFGDVRVEGAEQVLANWEVLKQAERGEQHVLDAVPLAMPALAQAQSLQSRAATAGLSGEPVTDAPGRPASTEPERTMTRAELGEELFGIVALARRSGVDAEEALRLKLRDFRAQMRGGAQR